MNKKIKITLVLIGLIIIAGLSYWSNSTQWKVYSHSHFGFQFTYPSDYQIKEYYFFGGLQLKVIDPSSQLTYFEVNVFGLNESAVEMDIPDDPIYSGPYPRKIHADDKNGEQTVIERKLNNISGVETFGSVDEGTNYFDSFNFMKNAYQWRVELNPVGEGRVKKMSLESGTETDFNQKNYERIRNSFKLI